MKSKSSFSNISHYSIAMYTALKLEYRTNYRNTRYISHFREILHHILAPKIFKFPIYI